MSRAYYCPSCGRLASEPCEACEKLRAEVIDLKARLRAVRRRHLERVGEPPDARGCATCRATDLRLKNWRKP